MSTSADDNADNEYYTTLYSTERRTTIQSTDSTDIHFDPPHPHIQSPTPPSLKWLQRRTKHKIPSVCQVGIGFGLALYTVPSW